MNVLQLCYHLFNLFYMTHALCPKPYEMQNGVCIFINKSEASVCEAWKTCENINGRLSLSKEIRLVRRFLGRDSYFTGISDLLNERHKNKSKWINVDGTEMNDVELWHKNEPNEFSGDQDCVDHEDKGIGDINCYRKSFILCVYNDVEPKPFRQFKKESFKIFNVEEGCYETYSGGTEMDCSVRCFQTIHCRSFYVSESKEFSCVLSIYFDSALSKRFEKVGKWFRYH